MESSPLPPLATSAPPDPSPTSDPSSSSPAMSAPSMPGSLSLVSRAKTALHSAAAKAEKVLTDIKTEIKSDRDSDGKSMRDRRMSVDRELSNASKEVIEKSSNAVDCSSSSKIPMMPPASAIRQLALAIENAKNIKSINDLSTSAGDPPPFKEKSGLSFSAVKSLVLREKEDNEEIRSLACSLFKSEEYFPIEKNGSEPRNLFRANVLKDLHGAPPESFLVKVSQAIAGFNSIQKMASFWQYITVELKNMWSEGQPIPQMPLDAEPDLDCCLLHQQLQVINCSIARIRRRSIAKESLNSIIREASPDREESLDSYEKTSPSFITFAKTKSGDYVLRLGAVQPSDNLKMLETGEPIYSPITQEGPVFTEELIKETEALVLQTGSVGPGCSQLLSDMQSFKAANPGCILEDFIRWYSPPDWTEVESNDQPTAVDQEEGSSRRGRLSRRMQKEGNLWLEIWEAAKALPAVNQAPIFDEDVEVENILITLENIQPSDLFEQLFVSLLSAGFIIAQASVPQDDSLAKLFVECKNFVIAAYQSGQSNEKLKDICQVYETVETIILHPEEVIQVTEQPQPDDTVATESKTEPKTEAKSDPKSRFKKLNLMRKEMQPPWKRLPRDDNKSEEKSPNIFSQIFDKKTSLFPKKSPKTTTPAPTTSNLDDNEWTIV